MHDHQQLPLISIGPRVRQSPFFDATRRHGAKSFTVYNHMYMPTLYTDPVTEYWSLVRDVTVWDVACQRQIEISGPDAFRLVQYLTPRDMSQCAVGQCQYLLLTDTDGGIVNDAVMLRLGEDRFWLSPGDGDALLWVAGVAASGRFEVQVFEPDVSPLQLQGPKSPHVMRALFGDAILGLRYYWLTECKLDDIPLIVSRTGWSGELGYELYLRDSRLGEQLWERVLAAGADHGIAPIAPSTIRSIEGGLLSYCSDIRRTDNPFVFGFDAFIDLGQADDFIGRKALLEIRRTGVQRKLAGIEIGGEPLPAGNDSFCPVADEKGVVGHVTRCIHSPRLEKNIGFANVPVTHAAPGTGLTVVTAWGDRRATVCRWPWFPPQKKLPADLRSAAKPG